MATTCSAWGRRLSITYFAIAGGALYAAGSGNETLNAAASSANVTAFGGSGSTGGNSLVGGAGNDVYVAGTGSDTMVDGAGSNQFVFSIGNAGGNDFIAGYTASDSVGLFNYGVGEAAAALATARVAGGSTTIMLTDNTKITFENYGTELDQDLLDLTAIGSRPRAHGWQDWPVWYLRRHASVRFQ